MKRGDDIRGGAGHSAGNAKNKINSSCNVVKIGEVIENKNRALSRKSDGVERSVLVELPQNASDLGPCVGVAVKNDLPIKLGQMHKEDATGFFRGRLER